MIKQLAAARYAKAYFAHCQKSNILNETSIESEKVLEIIFKEKNLNEIIKNKIVPNTTKKNILLSIYGGVSENLKNLIKTLVRKNRLYLFEDILNQFVELYKINSGIQTCYLISAEKISSKI